MRRCGAHGLAALVLLPAAAPAQAAQTTVSYSASDGVRVTGDSVADGVRASRSGSTVTITRLLTTSADKTAFNQLVAGAGCTGDEGQLTCTIPSDGIALLTFAGGGGSDELVATFHPDDIVADGGTGNDRLDGGRGRDLLDGGSGDDRVRGNAGSDEIRGDDDNDTLRGDAGNDNLYGGAGRDTLFDDLGTDQYFGDHESGGDAGADTFIVDDAPVDVDVYHGGGAGCCFRDHVSYASRTTPVSVRRDLSTSTRDGFPGSDTLAAELDDVKPDIEEVTGGAANDELVDAVSLPNSFVELNGGPGDDVLRAVGSSNGVVVRGGLGRDVYDVRSGERDILSTRDGEQDIVLGCGAGTDEVYADLRDDPIPGDCEFVDQGALREGPNVTFLTRRARVDAGRVAIRLRCPRELRRLGCNGTLRAALERRRPRLGPRTRYRIAAGRTATVVMALRPADRRALQRARRPRLRLVSVERGRHGPKTTKRVIRVRYSARSATSTHGYPGAVR